MRCIAILKGGLQAINFLGIITSGLNFLQLRKRGFNDVGHFC